MAAFPVDNFLLDNNDNSLLSKTVGLLSLTVYYLFMFSRVNGRELDLSD